MNRINDSTNELLIMQQLLHGWDEELTFVFLFWFEF